MSSTTAPITSEPQQALNALRGVVVAPVPLRAGGLGCAAAEFFDGLAALGHVPTYVGAQRLHPLMRSVNSRAFRRLFGMSASRRIGARATRRAVPETGWDLVYAIPGSIPTERGRGLRIIYQATRHPEVEWAALRRGERETGGSGDMSRAERRRREYEIARADLIHVTTKAVGDELLEAGVPAKHIVFSPHGVDLEAFKPGQKASERTLAFIGPMSLRKGVDIAAELGSRLNKDAIVEAVGGPSCPWSRRITERANFMMGGSVSETLRKSHALVLPSRSDGFSFVVLEALASGTVPFVTPEVGASEIVRQLDPRLVIERHEFADRVIELLPQIDFDSLSIASRRLAEKYDRRNTSRATVSAVMEQAQRIWVSEPDRRPDRLS